MGDKRVEKRGERGRRRDREKGRKDMGEKLPDIKNMTGLRRRETW